MARRFTHLPDLPTYQRDTGQIQQIHPYRMAASPHPDGLRKGSFVQFTGGATAIREIPLACQ